MIKVRKFDEGKEAECPDDTPPTEIQQSVGDINDDKNEDNDEEKESECLNDASPDEMEEDVSDKR